jgi:23S rRNA-/tRNA-specific pseudouridylate synthase
VQGVLPPRRRGTVRASVRVEGVFLPATTRYRVLASSEARGLSLLALSPLTGRKHQLRLHCAVGLGAPIVGDTRYGYVQRGGAADQDADGGWWRSGEEDVAGRGRRRRSAGWGDRRPSSASADADAPSGPPTRAPIMLHAYAVEVRVPRKAPTVHIAPPSKELAALVKALNGRLPR